MSLRAFAWSAEGSTGYIIGALLLAFNWLVALVLLMAAVPGGLVRVPFNKRSGLMYDSARTDLRVVA